MSWSQLAYSALVRGGIAALGRRRDAAPIFCFHNVVPDALAARRGDRSLHLGVTQFSALVSMIALRYEVAPLSLLLDDLESGAPLRGKCAITFDDAYAGAVRHALPILTTQQLPATLFVVANSPDAPQPFWWDALGDIDRLTESARDLTLSAGLGRAAFHAPAAQASMLPQEFLPASWEELSAWGKSPLVSFGSHTATHPNLTVLTDEDRLAELLDSRERLTSRLPGALTVLAYPYGLFDSRVMELAAAAGYSWGLALGGRTVRSSSPRYAIPRINVPASISRDALECWAAELR